MSNQTFSKRKVFDTDKIRLETSLAAKEDVLLDMHPIQNKNISLLRDHIKDMTSVVRRLSRDMERCEATVTSNSHTIATLTARLTASEGSSIVRTDMDNRLNRCDVGIAELVREIKDCNRNVNKLRAAFDTHVQSQGEKNGALEPRFAELERTIGKTEVDLGRQISHLKDRATDLGSASTTLEAGVSRDMSVLRDTCLNRLDSLLEDVETRCSAKIETSDQRIQAVSVALTTSIDAVSQDLEKLKSSQQSNLRALGDTDTQTSKAVSKLRGECMSGFKTLQESVDTMHSILDSKICLVEEDIRGEIRRAIKTVVVT